jgi:hypothetical protein
MESVPPLPASSPDYSLLGSGHTERGRRLFSTGLVALGVGVAYSAYTARTPGLLPLFQGLAMLVLSAVPALLWARSGGSRFPVLEPILLLCANAYALPMLNADEQLAGYPPEVITRAGWAVLLYQISAIGVYQATRGRPGEGRFWRESVITRQIEQLIVYGMVVSTAYVGLSTFASLVPHELESVLRAVFYGLGILCTFVSAQRWGRGEMKPGEKTVFVCTLLPLLIFMSTGLVLIGGMAFIGIALLGYVSGGKRIPWVVMAAAFAVVAILHNGKTPMRTKYWDEGYPAPTFTQLPAYYSEWVQYGLQPPGENKTVSRKLLERSSLMHILCLIVAYTPDRQDYLYGKTYGYVLPQLIPRLFWPDKPRSHVATYELSVYYGLQREEDTESTTISFGLLTEAYANFGFVGAILLGVFWGYTLKKLQLWSAFSPMFSFAGLLMILLTAWSFSAELTMAAWVSSFEQAVVVVLGIPMVIRSLFGN